jgi:subfamily B ATP-binding cassette protein MsbA
VYELSYDGERIVTDLRKQVYTHLHSLSLGFYAERRVGELISRLSSDATLIRTALTSNVATVLSQTLTFIGSLVLMLVLNWRLTLFIWFGTPGGAQRRFGVVCAGCLPPCRISLPTAALAEKRYSVRVVKAQPRALRDRSLWGADRGTLQATMQMTVAAFGVDRLHGVPLGAVLAWRARGDFGRLLRGADRLLIYGINISAALGAFTGLYTPGWDAQRPVASSADRPS